MEDGQNLPNNQVTVIIPAYNRPDELRKALFSLAAQTDPRFNVLVSDDASSVPLEPVCAEFNGVLNISYIKSHKNRGCGGNRQFALDYFYRNNPTKYLMFMDSDDALMPQAIARLSIAIDTNQADIINTNILKETLGRDVERIANTNKTWLHGKIYRTDFLKEHNITFPQIGTNEDLAFNLSIYAYNDELESYLLNEDLYLWRTHDNSITKNKQNSVVLQKCHSVDYIDAIYHAFLHYRKTALSLLMKANIMNCYTYYQNGKIFGVLTEQNKTRMRQMLRYPEIGEALVSLYRYPNTDLSLKQWCIKNDAIVFYGQTYGQWIMEFYTQEEIKQLINKYYGQN